MNCAHLLLPLAALLTACQHEPSPQRELPVSVHCMSPKLEAWDEILELRGHLEPPPGGDLPVASQVPGRLVEVRVREGQRVGAGEIIALVDDAASQGALRQAEATLAQARAGELNANATLERTRALVSRGIAARQELEDGVARAETARQAVAAAQAALDLARRTLGRVQVRAAFGGVVTRLWRGPGALVDATAATPIVQIAAAIGVEFVADATERQIARVKPGQLAEVQISSHAETFHGVVRVLPSALDSSTGLGSIRFALDTPPAPVPMGAHGRVKIQVQHHEGVLTLPTQALRGAVSDGAEVVLCEAGSAQVRAVRVGYRDAGRFEVLSGVSAGERVAIDHVLGLESGTHLLETP